MASSCMTIKLVFMLLICMVISAPLAQAGLKCGVVAVGIKACETYLTTIGISVPISCCIGWSNVVNAVSSSTPGHLTACLCLKTIVSQLNVNYTTVNQISTRCGLTTSFSLSPTLTCTSIV